MVTTDEVQFLCERFIKLFGIVSKIFEKVWDTIKLWRTSLLCVCVWEDVGGVCCFEAHARHWESWRPLWVQRKCCTAFTWPLPSYVFSSFSSGSWAYWCWTKKQRFSYGQLSQWESFCKNENKWSKEVSEMEWKSSRPPFVSHFIWFRESVPLSDYARNHRNSKTLVSEVVLHQFFSYKWQYRFRRLMKINARNDFQ